MYDLLYEKPRPLVEQSHAPDVLARYGLAELHLPVPDFTPPTPEQLGQGVAAIEHAIASSLGIPRCLLQCPHCRRHRPADRQATPLTTPCQRP